MEKNIKIGAGLLRGKKLYSPSSEITRPNNQRAREAFFNILKGEKFRELPFAKMVDGFAGSGVFAFEAMSQEVVKSVVLVEKDSEAFKVVKANLESVKSALPAENISIQNNDIVDEIGVHSDADLLFFDPPYSSDVLQKLVKKICYIKWKVPEDLLIVFSTDAFDYEKSGRKKLFEENFEIIDDRKYGKNKLVFCKLK